MRYKRSYHFIPQDHGRYLTRVTIRLSLQIVGYEVFLIMAAKALATKLRESLPGLQDAINILNKVTVSQFEIDDEFDADYAIGNIVKSVSRLTGVLKKYEGQVANAPENSAVGTTKNLVEKPDSEKSECGSGDKTPVKDRAATRDQIVDTNISVNLISDTEDENEASPVKSCVAVTKLLSPAKVRILLRFV